MSRDTELEEHHAMLATSLLWLLAQLSVYNISRSIYMTPGNSYYLLYTALEPITFIYHI